MATFASPGTVPRGKRVSMQWTREGEDVASIGMHFTKIAGTEIVEWDTGAYERVESNLAAIWEAIRGRYSPTIAAARFVWHDWGVDVRAPNPNVRETPLTDAAGTADAGEDSLPPQTALSVTFKTSVRRDWGRVYLPAPTTPHDTAGRVAAELVNAVRTAFGTMVDDQADHDSPLVIWSPRHGGGPLDYGDGTKAGRAAAHAAGTDNPDSSSFARTVDQVQVDDLWDVIRSRRYGVATLKATHMTA